MHTFASCLKFMKKIIYILLIGLVFVSCSEYQKILKSEDTALKFKTGTELYDAGKWSKANRIFEQIVPKYRGKPQAEKLMYMHAMCFYNLEQYYLSGYRLEQFSASYQNSEKSEEASFLSAKSYYRDSPIYSKEQEETEKALEKLQLFINAYPDSDYLKEANVLIRELDLKLETKAYEIARQYNKISDYKASIKSFNNFLLDFPGSTLRNDALYYRLEAARNLAVLSVEYLKQQRIEEALEYYNALKKAFPNSEFLESANDFKTELESLKTEDNTKS